VETGGFIPLSSICGWIVRAVQSRGRFILPAGTAAHSGRPDVFDDMMDLATFSRYIIVWTQGADDRMH
jgi:hypothetical protein